MNKWLIIKKITTRKGIFGNTNKLTKEETRKMMSCPVGLGQNHLVNQNYCDLPLRTTGSIAFPDKMWLDDNQQEYILEFFNSWKIEKVKTLIRFKKKDLELAFSAKYKNRKDD